MLSPGFPKPDSLPCFPPKLIRESPQARYTKTGEVIPHSGNCHCQKLIRKAPNSILRNAETEIGPRTSQYAMGPTSFSTSAISTMTMASHGQPSRKQPSGPLLRHFLQPMHWMG